MNAPLTPEACETIWDFTCKSAVVSPDCAPFLAIGPSLSCECSKTRLHPEDCQLTAQFRCAVYQPVAEGCECAVGAPSQADDCAFFGAQYTCYSYSPDIGCSCAEITPIK